jgi:hypothetical protein
MATLRILLVILLGVLGFEYAERAVIAHSMSALRPPEQPAAMQALAVFPPPLPAAPPPPPPPDPHDDPHAQYP